MIDRNMSKVDQAYNLRITNSSRQSNKASGTALSRNLAEHPCLRGVIRARCPSWAHSMLVICCWLKLLLWTPGSMPGIILNGLGTQSMSAHLHETNLSRSYMKSPRLGCQTVDLEECMPQIDATSCWSLTFVRRSRQITYPLVWCLNNYFRSPYNSKSRKFLSLNMLRHQSPHPIQLYLLLKKPYPWGNSGYPTDWLRHSTIKSSDSPQNTHLTMSWRNDC